MKLILVALALVRAGAIGTSSGTGAFLEELNHAPDAMSVMSKLTGMMGQAQQKLALVERRHQKVVKKLRKESEAMLQQESDTYGKYFNGYATELAQATADLENVVSMAKAALAKAEAAPVKLNDWKDPDVELRAKLGAQVAAVERNAKRSERHRDRQVKEAEEHAEETIEDNAQRLGMKLGDMSPIVDTAKKTLEGVAEKAPVLAAAKKVQKENDSKQLDLKGLEDTLAKATSIHKTKTTDANQRLDGFLGKQDKEIYAKTEEIKKHLDTAQKEEIEKVMGHKQESPVKAPAKKVAVSKKEKVAPTKAAAPAKVAAATPAKVAATKK
jgi:hypothetical protein